MGEVFPSMRVQSVTDSVAADEEYLSGSRDTSDPSNADASQTRRDGLARRRGKKQFVVFAAVECQLEIYFVRRFTDGRLGYGFRQQLRSHAAFFADVGEVGGEAVAGVDHGRGESVLTEDAAEFHTRLGKEMSWIAARVQFAPGLPAHRHNRGRGAAKLSADVNIVAGSGARAQNGLSFGHGTQDNDVRQDAVGRLCRITPGESDAIFSGQPDQASSEAINPRVGQISREGHGKKCGDRCSTHGRDVTQSSRQTTMSDRFWLVPLPPEVDSFQRKISCQ